MDLHRSLRNCGTRFDSWTGYRKTMNAEREAMNLRSEHDSVQRSSFIVHRLQPSPECAGFARDPAKVEDQVRFLARTLQEVRSASDECGVHEASLKKLSTPNSALHPTLEPDGQATVCRTVSSGFDSHRRLATVNKKNNKDFQARFTQLGQAALSGSRCELLDRVLSWVLTKAEYRYRLRSDHG
jgi:hypothetical protein